MAWHTLSRSIPSGNAGNRETLKAMSSLAAAGSKSPLVIEAAQNAVRGTPERDDEVDFAAVLKDVRRRMRYTHDPLDAEVVKHPAFVVSRTNDPESSPEPMDCDDASTLCAAMLGALGYQTRFATVAADPSRPREWSHVYVVARRNDGRWVALDPIVRKFAVGDEVPDAHVTDRVYHAGVNPMRMNRRSLLSGLGETMPEIPSLAPVYETARVSEGGYSNLGPSAGSTSWWERLFDSTSRAAATVIRAKQGPGTVRIVNKAPASPGFFTKADGSTDWAKVGLVGGAVLVGGAILVKLAKAR